MHESQLLHFEHDLNSNSYEEYLPKRIPLSPPRLRGLSSQNKSTFLAFDHAINNPNESLTLNRTAYKLRMKSDLHIESFKETHRRYSQRTQNHTISNIRRSATTKTIPLQATNLKKTNSNDEFKGIEGNAIRVELLDKLSKQTDHTELHPPEYLDNSSTSISNTRPMNAYTIPKSQSFIIERIEKQPRILTEYKFNAPTFSRTTSGVYRSREREKSNGIDVIDVSRQRFNTLDQQSRKKSATHLEKQVYICNKLNINDTIKSKQNEFNIPISKHPSARFIFPYMRPFGYLTKLSTDNLPRIVSSSNKKRTKEQKFSKDSFESFSMYNDANSQLFNDTIKSMMSLAHAADDEDDLQNPPNTFIDFDSKQDKQ